MIFLISAFGYLTTGSATMSSEQQTPTKADWGFVVDVTYSLYTRCAGCDPVENNINNPLSNIYVIAGTTVPPEVLAAAPGASANYLEKFKEGIVGARVGEKKSFVILAQDGYETGALAGENLYFDVTVDTIKYYPPGYVTTTPSSSTDSTTTATTTTTTPENNDQLFVFGGVSFIAVVVVAILVVVRSNLRVTESKDLIQEKSSVRQKKKLDSLLDKIETRKDPNDLNDSITKPETKRRPKRR